MESVDALVDNIEYHGEWLITRLHYQIMGHSNDQYSLLRKNVIFGAIMFRKCTLNWTYRTHMMWVRYMHLSLYWLIEYVVVMYEVYKGMYNRIDMC